MVKGVSIIQLHGEKTSIRKTNHCDLNVTLTLNRDRRGQIRVFCRHLPGPEFEKTQEESHKNKASPKTTSGTKTENDLSLANCG